MFKKIFIKLSWQLFIILFLLPAFSSPAGAAYLQDVPVTVSQPDGAILNCLASGDEFFNYLHDAGGNIIIQHPASGYYTYAQLDAWGKLTASGRAAADNGYYYNYNVLSGLYSPAYRLEAGAKIGDIDFSLNAHLLQEFPQEPGAPPRGAAVPGSAADAGIAGQTVQGSMENVIVMICFADENPAITPAIAGKIESVCNGPFPSLKNYMQIVSAGLLNVDSTLVGLNGGTALMYQDSHPRGYFQPYSATNTTGYAGGDGGAERRDREHALLRDAVNAIADSPLLAGKNLDITGNGRVDSITFIASGDVDGWDNLLWPHQWNLSYLTTLNGKRVDAYSFHLLNRLFPAAGNSNLGVLCHEALHVFGMPDLYRYTSNGTPVGFWDVMASNAASPQLPNTHLRQKYAGWGQNPAEITANGHYTLYPLGSTEGITAYTIATSNPNQFILLEYRSNSNGSGYDTTFGGSFDYHKGLTIARINKSFNGNANRSGGTDDEVYIYRPGETALNKGGGSIAAASLTAESGRVSFGNDSAASGYEGTIYLYNGANTQYIISNISAAGATLSFNVKINNGVMPGVNVSGLVKSYYPPKCATVELVGEGKEPYTATTAAPASGSGQTEQPFTFANVEPGTYTLTISKDAHTKFSVRNIVVEDKDVDLTKDSRPEVQLMTLRCGDINGDGNINNSDLTILWQQANYNRSASAAANPLCDLNGDGLINNIDLTILWLAYNYNRGEIEIN